MPEQARPLLREVVGAARAPLYRGDRYECPCCGFKARTFLAGGVDNRENVVCPRCGSAERHRLLALYLERHMPRNGASVLHVAPEECLEAKLRGPNYVSGDIDGHGMMRLDVQNLPFPDEKFDVVICYHVLEHVPDDYAAMRELHRVLSRTGWALLQSPIWAEHHTIEDPATTTPEARKALYGQDDHRRAYGPDFPDRLRTVFRVEPAQSVSPELIDRYRLDSKEILYVCRR